VAEKIALDEVKALRLQLAIAAAENTELKVQAVLKKTQAAVDAAWVAAGLTPGVTYNIDFAALTAVEVAADSENAVK
jgi:hypothetical protein